MKKLLFICLLLFTIVLQSQNYDKMSCEALNDKAMEVYLKNPDLAMKLIKISIEKVKNENDGNLKSVTKNNLAILLRMKGEFLESKKLSNQSLKSAKETLTIASIYNNLGACNRSLGLYDEAIKDYLKALKIYEDLNEIKRQATVNNNIGMVFSSLEQYDKAKKYHKKALQLFTDSKDKKGLSEAYNNLAITMATQDSLKESMIFFRKSLNIEEDLKDQKGIAESLNNVGEVHYYLGSIDSALFYYKKSAGIEEKLKNFPGVSESYNNIAQVYLEIKQYPKAKFFIDSAYIYAQRSKVAQAVLTSLDNYKVYYESIGNFIEANKRIKEFYNFKDSIQKKSKVKDLNELETKYQTSKKEKLLLEKEAEAKQKNNTIITLSILAFALSLIGFLIYRQQKLKNAQQTQEFELKSAISKIETQNKLQEQRLSISRDLHDNIGSQLTFIISSVDNVKYGFDISNKKLDDKLTNISGFAKDTIVELRDTIWAMNSNEISFEDLESRINNYIQKAKESQLQISFSFAIDKSLKSKKFTSVEGMNIYRTIQEAINNSLKYAQADIISVNIKKQENQIKITVLDNGKGFDLATIEKGNGLNNMKKRIEEISGNFNLQSDENGTRIEILI